MPLLAAPVVAGAWRSGTVKIVGCNDEDGEAASGTAPSYEGVTAARRARLSPAAKVYREVFEKA